MDRERKKGDRCGRASELRRSPPSAPLVNRHLVGVPACRPTDDQPEPRSYIPAAYHFLEMARQRARNFVAGRESNMAAARNETTGTPRFLSLPRTASRASSVRRAAAFGPQRRSREREKERERRSERIRRSYLAGMDHFAGRNPERSDSISLICPEARNARGRDHRRRDPEQRTAPTSGGMATGSTRAALRRTSRNPPWAAATATAIPRRDDREANGS